MEDRGIIYRSAAALRDKNTPSFSGGQAVTLIGEGEEPCAILRPRRSIQRSPAIPTIGIPRFQKIVSSWGSKRTGRPVRRVETEESLFRNHARQLVPCSFGRPPQEVPSHTWQTTPFVSYSRAQHQFVRRTEPVCSVLQSP